MSSYYLPESYTFFPEGNDRFSTHPIPPSVDTPSPDSAQQQHLRHQTRNAKRYDSRAMICFALTNAQRQT